MPRGRGRVLDGGSGDQDCEMTFEFYGWIIEYYVFSISPGHGNSGRGRSESRGDAFDKYLHRRHARTTSARDTPVAAHVTKAERQPPVIKAGTSSSMHPPPTLARGPTGKAVLALVVRSRTLTYALWACPVDAVGCTAAALAAKTER